MENSVSLEKTIFAAITILLNVLFENCLKLFIGERPYVCEVPGCLKRFTEYSSLYKHNIVHTQQKPYTCALCHKTYRQTSTLAMHKRTVHGTEDLTETERQGTHYSFF